MFILWVSSYICTMPSQRCHKIGLYANVCRSKSKGTGLNQYRSNNQSAWLTRNKNKITTVHLVTDEDQVLKLQIMRQLWTNPQCQKPITHKAFKRVEMYSANR